MTTAVVVGGGIGGLLAGSVLRDNDIEVVIVDPAAHLGGLLASTTHGGFEFDFGTHLPQETGVAEIDHLLFSRLDPDEWLVHPVQRAGNVFWSSLDERTVFPDVNRLPGRLAEQAHRELLDAGRDPLDEVAPSAHVDITTSFGPTVRDHVIGPVVERLLGTELTGLDPAVHRLFVGRVVAFTPDRTRELKRGSGYDAILAFHDAAEGANPRRSFYPRVGGCGRWIDVLTDQLMDDVEWLRTTVTKVEARDGRAEAVLLEDGTLLDCDFLVWTLPSPALARMADIEPAVSTDPPSLVPAELHHVAFDRPFLTDRFYFPCFDVDTDVFRVTLYPNLRMDDGAGGHTCTIEVLRGDDDRGRPLATDPLVRDLMAFGIVDHGARVLGSWTDRVAAGFPRRTPESSAAVRLVADQLEEEMTNVRIVGRGSGRSFFMAEVLTDVHERVNGLV